MRGVRQRLERLELAIIPRPLPVVLRLVSPLPEAPAEEWGAFEAALADAERSVDVVIVRRIVNPQPRP